MGNQERQVWGQHCEASMGLGGEGLEGTQRVSGARGLELRLGAWPGQDRMAWQWVSWGQRRQPGEALGVKTGARLRTHAWQTPSPTGPLPVLSPACPLNHGVGEPREEWDSWGGQVGRRGAREEWGRWGSPGGSRGTPGGAGGAGSSGGRREPQGERGGRPTSLKSSSRRCCLRRSIFLTATSLPELRTVAMHTMPVEPSPILMKLSR